MDLKYFVAEYLRKMPAKICDCNVVGMFSLSSKFKLYYALYPNLGIQRG